MNLCALLSLGKIGVSVMGNPMNLMVDIKPAPPSTEEFDSYLVESDEFIPRILGQAKAQNLVSGVTGTSKEGELPKPSLMGLLRNAGLHNMNAGKAGLRHLDLQESEKAPNKGGYRKAGLRHLDLQESEKAPNKAGYRKL